MEEAKVSKQARKAALEYVGERIALQLYVTPEEKEGLRAMGYDPDKLICIERFNDETVFLQVQYFDAMKLSIGSNTLVLDDRAFDIDVAPEIDNNRTMLPIRAIAEAAGAQVTWEQDTSSVIIYSASGDEITCTIGSETLTVNNIEKEMDVVPYVKAGRTYLPVRAVSEALSMDVEWESETQTVTLTSPYQTGRILVEAERFDATGLNAEKIVSDGDGLWIMQFSSPSEARAAALMLEARGLQVEPDKYIPPIDEQPIIATSTSGKYYSWGVTDCKFDSFIESYSNLLSSSGIVAVVDTGIDSTHSLLHGRTLAGYDFVDGDADPSPTDNEYHGTHVAGTILDCVGDTPVNILPIRVLGSNGGTTAAVVAGIKYAVSSVMT